MISFDFPKTFSGFSQHFLRTFSGLSKDFLRTFSEISPNIQSFELIALALLSLSSTTFLTKKKIMWSKRRRKSEAYKLVWNSFLHIKLTRVPVTDSKTDFF